MIGYWRFRMKQKSFPDTDGNLSETIGNGWNQPVFAEAGDEPIFARGGEPNSFFQQ